MDTVKDQTTERTGNVASATKGQVTLRAGTRVLTPGGWPVHLVTDVAAEAHTANIPIIERDMASTLMNEHGDSER